MNANILMRPGSFENPIQGVKRAREDPINELMENTIGGSFYRFSPNGLCVQQDYKARRLHDSNLGRTDFLYQGWVFLMIRMGSQTRLVSQRVSLASAVTMVASKAPHPRATISLFRGVKWLFNASI